MLKYVHFWDILPKLFYVCCHHYLVSGWSVGKLISSFVFGNFFIWQTDWSVAKPAIWKEAHHLKLYFKNQWFTILGLLYSIYMWLSANKSCRYRFCIPMFSLSLFDGVIINKKGNLGSFHLIILEVFATSCKKVVRLNGSAFTLEEFIVNNVEEVCSRWLSLYLVQADSWSVNSAK